MIFLLILFISIPIISFPQNKLSGKKLTPLVESGFLNNRIVTYGNDDSGTPLYNIPGMTGFFDYQTNGNNLKNILVFGDTIVTCWILADSTDPTGLTSRKAAYIVSYDGGNSWMPAPLELTVGRSAYPSLVKYIGLIGRSVTLTGRTYTPSQSGACWNDASLGLGAITQYIPSPSSGDIISSFISNPEVGCTQFRGDTLKFFKFRNDNNIFTSTQTIATTPQVISSNGRQFLAINNTGSRIFSMWYNATESKIFYSESQNGGTSFSSPAVLHQDGDVINGDATSPWISGDVIYKPGTNTPCVAWSTLGPGQTLTRTGSKILFWSPGINGGTPVVIADWHNYATLNDSLDFESLIGLQVGVSPVSHPSIAYSDDGSRLYCVFSGVVTDSLDGFNKNQIYITYSNNNGLTWSDPESYTSFAIPENSGAYQYDELYPTISEEGNTGNHVHVIYQATKGPGSQSFSDNSPVYRVWQCYLDRDLTTVIENNATQLQKTFTLNQNYPNPFNPETEISFSLTKKSIVSLNIYDVSGKLVKSILNNEEINAGQNSVIFKSENISSGIYFYALITNDGVLTKKMVLLK